MSVNEAFDRLPAGLAYYTAGGVPILVNEAMQELSRNIFGGPVTDAHEFWKNLKSHDIEGAAGDDESAIVRAGDKIYSIRQRALHISGIEVYELTGADISKEYGLTRELEEKRDRARVLNIRLKALMETLEYVSMNRELLKLKTALHDNIGQSILIAKRYLYAPEPEDWELPYYVISKEADFMGIRLNIIGELPKERELIPIVDTAVSAQISNTLKHTNGNEITISVSETGDEYILSLKNDGEATGGRAEPKGGLENLRRKLEEAGGRMEIISSPDFILKITLPKGI